MQRKNRNTWGIAWFISISFGGSMIQEVSADSEDIFMMTLIAVQ